MQLLVRSGADAGRVLIINGPVVVGRDATCELVLTDEKVSSRHARISPVGDGWQVEDLDSANGTFVNGSRITAATTLTPTDLVRVGTSDLALQHSSGATRADAAAGGTRLDQGATVTLTILSGGDAGLRLPVPNGASLTLGRGPDCDVRLTDDRVSGQHARLARTGDAVTVEDLGSSNGTWVNDSRIKGVVSLTASDRLRVGGDEIRLEGAGAGAGVADVGGTVLRSGPVAAAPPTPLPSRQPLPRAGSAAPGRVAPTGRRGRGRLLAGAVAALIIAGGGVAGYVVLSDDEGTGEGAGSVFTLAQSRTVRIFVESAASLGTGSGSVIDVGEGFVLTNNHVATGGKIFIDNPTTGRRSPADLIGAAPCDDLALVRFSDPRDADGLQQVEFDPAPQAAGTEVFAVGFPVTAESGSGSDIGRFGTDSISITEGIISKPDVPVRAERIAPLPSAIQHTAAVNPGNSGGPLFDREGRQVGVNTAGGGLEGVLYAITAKRALEVVEEMRRGGFPKWIGVALSPLTGEDGTPIALQVDAVTPGSPADKAGITGGAVIIGIDGTRTTTIAEYCSAVPDDAVAPFTLTLAGPDSTTVDVSLRSGGPT